MKPCALGTTTAVPDACASSTLIFVQFHDGGGGMVIEIDWSNSPITGTDGEVGKGRLKFERDCPADGIQRSVG